MIVQLLRANGVNTENSTLLPEDLDATGSALTEGKADAGILILAPETERIQRLLRAENIRLMDFSPEAKAYTSRFPALTSVVMYRASVEFEPVIPSADITLLATSPALIVRKSLPPALVSLLASAVLQNPKSPFDSSGDPVLFHKAGQFPNADDPEYEVADAARMVYKSGDLPLLLRMIAPLNARMHMPFALTSFASAYGIQTVLLLIPTLTILLPLLRLVPMLYSWTIRQRLIYWYAALKALERKMDHSDASVDMAPLLGEIERIDAAARRVRVPLEYSDQLYDLRGHIDLVRRRVHQWPEPLKYVSQQAIDESVEQPGGESPPAPAA